MWSTTTWHRKRTVRGQTSDSQTSDSRCHQVSSPEAFLRLRCGKKSLMLPQICLCMCWLVYVSLVYVSVVRVLEITVIDSELRDDGWSSLAQLCHWFTPTLLLRLCTNLPPPLPTHGSVPPCWGFLWSFQLSYFLVFYLIFCSFVLTLAERASHTIATRGRDETYHRDIVVFSSTEYIYFIIAVIIGHYFFRISVDIRLAALL